jgi:multidrug efflux pump subunit AcrB
VKAVVEWFTRNPVAANLVMIVLMVGGLLTWPKVRMELFPEFALDRISVAVPYPGAAPEEVEEAICTRIEEEVHALDGVKRVTSVAAEGLGTVLVELERDARASRVLDDVTTRVNAISTFPELAEKPIIEELTMRQQVINVAVHGEVGERALRLVGEEVRDELSEAPGISLARLASARPFEVSIEVSEAELQRHGLGFDDLARAVRLGSLDLSGGTLRTPGGEVLLRTKAQAYRGEDFRELTLVTRPDGTRITLGDVATVVDGFEDTSQAARFNGEPMVQVQVFRTGDENAIEIAAAVREYVARKAPELPAGVTLTPYADTTVLLEGRLSLLSKNGLQGLLLVFVVLSLFLRFRLAFWVTAGIPISFLGVLWLMPSLDVSINMLSLFAFILVLGIVVDDAIVIGESVFTEQKRDPDQLGATIRGANRVAVPVTFAVMTTVTAFAPMLDLPGMFGNYFGVIPMAVIPILLFSWAESKVILPAHLAHGGAWATRLAAVPPFRWWVAFQGRFERGLEWVAERLYRPSLELCLRWRYLTHAATLAVLLVTGGLVAGGFVRVIDFPKINGDLVFAQLTMPLGTSPEVTSAAVRQIEDAALRLEEEVREEYGRDLVLHWVTAVGEQPMRSQQKNQGGGGPGLVGSHLGEILMELVPTEEREDVPTEALIERWRELCGPIPGAVELLFTADVMGGGDAIAIQFAGNDVDALRAAAAELQPPLGALPGVFDVADSFRGGKQELRLDILPRAEALGLSRGELARQVRQAFHGEEAQRIQRGRNEVKVMVRYPEEARRTLDTLERMRIRTPAGDEVPFVEVARVELDRGYATISRSDRKRVVTVTADIDETVTTTGDVVAALREGALADIVRRHPSVSWSVEGQSAELRLAMDELLRLAIVALLVIYALMAIPFRSYVQPAIVMSAVPLGLIGAVLGHILMGYDISVLSLVGLVALTGVVVNDSLVMVEFINRRREEGGDLADAVRRAGVERFRPILLTSMTTFAGLTPLMFETSVQAQFLIPMAIALAFGVIFSTAVSLVFVPAAYLILDDLARLFGGAPRREPGAATASTEGA